ncbi:MAG: hypothetical protein WCS96_01210 [Victivallales bacterium]
MKLKNTLEIILFSLLSAGLMSALSGCYGIPKGTTGEAAVGQLQLKATSAGIVKADTQKTTYRIKCSLCSFENENKTILTPTVDNPYVLDWLCPNCGHRQIIMIQSFTQQSAE